MAVGRGAERGRLGKQAMKKPIRVLIVEDSEFDARVLVNTLRQGGYDPQFRRVETAESMREALVGGAWEVVLSDYNLSQQFNALGALEVLQESGLDLPFLIISGGIGEDVAVAAMKAGAHDYVMKGNLVRLVPAVEREMREAATRLAGRQSEEDLRDSEQRNRLLWENSTDAVLMMEADGTIRFANPAVATVFGYEAAYVVGKNFSGLLVEGARSDFAAWATAHLASSLPGANQQPILTIGCHQAQREVHIEIGFNNVVIKGRRYLVAFIRDITERKRAEEESRLLQGVSLVVNTAQDLDTALYLVLQTVCQTTGWSLGQAWLPSPDGKFLECSPAWHSARATLQPFRQVSEGLRFERGRGLPGRAWELRRPVWMDDIAVRPNSSRASIAREVGIVAGAGIPVLADEELVAVIEFFLTEKRAKDERTVQLFSAVAAQVGTAIRRKRAEQELQANEEEFRVARDIQERLFPKGPPLIPGFDLAGLSRAASAAGGDYFDFLPILNGAWGIAVGDVTGHGIGPALLMAETRAYLRVLAQTRADVAAVLTAANRVLSEDIGSERFITMLLAALDPIQRTLSFVNAGHPAGYVLDVRGDVKAVLKRTGVPLGIRADTVYPSGPAVQLAAGDLVLLLTDGIDEAMAPDDSIFGLERTLAVVRANRERPAREVIEALYEEVQRFTRNAPQGDDATAVVVRVL